MGKPTVLMVGADAGGVGKTTTARLLADYADARGMPLRTFDTEHPRGDLRRFRHDAEIVDIGSVTGQMRVFDSVDERAVTLVDIRAGLLSRTLKALNEAKFLDDNIDLVVCHVLGPKASSLDEIALAAKAIGGGASHRIVLNHPNDSEFQLGQDPEWADVFRSMKADAITIAKLSETATEKIQALGISFVNFTKNLTSAGTPAQYSRLLRGYTASWMESVWAEFDRVAVIKAAIGSTERRSADRA